MQTVDEYLRQAEACRIRASAIPNEEDRAKFVSLAVQWERLAVYRDQLLHRQQEAEAMDDARLPDKSEHQDQQVDSGSPSPASTPSD